MPEQTKAQREPGGSQTSGSQTLSRGLTALSLLADHGTQSIQSLADLLGVHRSVAYRLVRTLEEHRLVVRDAAGMLALGPQLVVLARDVEHDLQSASLPQLQQLADELGMTAFLAVRDGDDAVTLATAVPRGVNASVAQHPGHRHPLALGAPGIALQALLSDAAWRDLGHDEPMHPEVERVRTRGYAVSANEVIQGITAVGAPVRARGTTDAAVAVVTVGEPDTVQLGDAVQRTARAIEAELR
ncbi:IclR family transcriptional regulator [Agrococcus sp. Marseille-P2731]|uniref:IclR family transcriptional regulator n=1 Tax=Agrococcus sp. Marseille-P2731 TaxID=1841862 RepID=UPI000931A96D|nr:helix-turn-helix domain-containing protein [Agrococcus sp. Marseille-P2731]